MKTIQGQAFQAGWSSPGNSVVGSLVQGPEGDHLLAGTLGLGPSIEDLEGDHSPVVHCLDKSDSPSIVHEEDDEKMSIIDDNKPLGSGLIQSDEYDRN